MSKWEVVDSYGIVIHEAKTLTACGVWIDPLMGIDFTRRMWGKDELGRGIDDDRFWKNEDGSYTVEMYEDMGTLTVRKRS